jgi:hypothetical protein
VDSRHFSLRGGKHLRIACPDKLPILNLGVGE